MRWSTLDPANPAKFYASGPHTFFDIAPLKYGSWEEYSAGVKGVLSGYKSAKFTLNDDVAIHPHGDLVWATATVKEEMTTKRRQSRDGQLPLDRGVRKSRWQVVDRSRTCLRTAAVELTESNATSPGPAITSVIAGNHGPLAETTSLRQC